MNEIGLELQRLATYRLYDEIQAGRSALPLLKDLLRDYGTASVGLFTGAVSGSLGLLRQAEAAGWSFDGSASALAVEFTRAFADRDLMKVCELTATVASRVDEIRGAISFGLPKAEQKPVRVEIVSMPTRERIAAVERDVSGSITSSTQIERLLYRLKRPTCFERKLFCNQKIPRRGGVLSAVLVMLFFDGCSLNRLDQDREEQG